MRIPRKSLLLFWILIIILGSLSQNYISRENNTQYEKDDEQQSTDQTDSTETEGHDVLIIEDSASLGGTSKPFEYKYVFSSSLLGLLIVSIIAILFLLLINSSELKQYIGTALKLAGFKGRLSTISRKIRLENGINIKIFGIQKIKVKISAPLFENFLYFGLREELNGAVTITDLQNFPIKMQIMHQYLVSNQ